MKFVNKKVEHIKFGKGTIVEADKKNISVVFEDVEGEKLFQYPEAFGKFLKTNHPKLKEVIKKDYDNAIDLKKLESEKVEQARLDAKEKVKEEAVKPKKPAKKAKTPAKKTKTPAEKTKTPAKKAKKSN